MSTRWERLAGDTARFGVRIAFSDDPDGGARASTELAASWGTLTLWADGVNLTAHSVEGLSIEGVSWYLLPFLEWVAENWDALLHEERLPNVVRGDDAAASLRATGVAPPATAHDASRRWEQTWQAWWRRHALQSCREGGLFPDVVMRRWRDRCEVSWTSSAPAGAPRALTFLASQGCARLPPAEVASALHQVALEAARYLQSTCPDSTRLATLAERLRQLTSPLRAEGRLAWLAGFEANTPLWQKLTSGPTKVLFDAPLTHGLCVEGSCHGALLFGSMAPTLKDVDVLRIAKRMLQASSDVDAPLYAVQRPTPVGHGRSAWRQGYELAEEVRSTLGLADDELAEPAEVLGKLGVAIVEDELSDRGTRAIAFAGAGLRPTVLLPPSAHAKATRLRFTLAHELCHLLLDRDAGCRLAIATGPWAPPDLERRANAFAAAFLMPEAAVARVVEQVPAAADDPTWVARIAQLLRTSFSATLSHLHNLGYVDDIQYETIKEHEGL